MGFNPGEFVTRKSYGSDIIFKIEKINDNQAILRSYRLRLLADAPLDDLIPYETAKNRIKKNIMLESYEYIERQQRNLILNGKTMRNGNLETYRERPGKILHIDGDKDFLEMSLQNYQNLQLDVKGIYISERGQPEKIISYLKRYKPDILVITGHDGVVNNKDYRTSEYFVSTVQLARTYESDLDNLVIFAGACQSDYQKLIDSGANFASSPQGVLIHFLDPILVAEKIAYTSVREVLSVKEVVKATVTGREGIGGVETRGRLRLCFP